MCQGLGPNLVTKLPVTFGLEMKTQWLKLVERGYLLDNVSELAVAQPNSSLKIKNISHYTIYVCVQIYAIYVWYALFAKSFVYKCPCHNCNSITYFSTLSSFK